MPHHELPTGSICGFSLNEGPSCTHDIVHFVGIIADTLSGLVDSDKSEYFGKLHTLLTVIYSFHLNGY